MSKKCRLIWDDCTPTRERRPTTEEDVEDDIHVEDYVDDREMLDRLLDLAGYDEDDLDLDPKASNKAKIEELLNVFDDPGDGSPNILYASINCKSLDGALPYDCLDGLDLETVDEDEVIEAVKGENVYDDDEDDEEDDDEEEKPELKKYNLAVNIRGDDYDILLSTDDEEAVSKRFIEEYEEYGIDLFILDCDGNNDSYDELTSELIRKAEDAAHADEDIEQEDEEE